MGPLCALARRNLPSAKEKNPLGQCRLLHLASMPEDSLNYTWSPARRASGRSTEAQTQHMPLTTSRVLYGGRRQKSWTALVLALTLLSGDCPVMSRDKRSIIIS